MTILLQRISEGEDVATESSFGAVESEFGNLPLRQLAYHANVLGLAVRTTILQTYCNPFDEAIEAKYVFPLEYGQAVIACEMRLADRVVQAELKERAEARREYVEAVRNGYRAALLEENRPETFSMSVGNIPPGESVQICILTVSQLPVVCGEWTLRLPLVVAPRYTSGFPLPRAACGSGTACDTDQVPDASVVTPPTWLPGFASPVDLRLVVDMDWTQLPCSSDWAHQLKSSLHTALIDTFAVGAPDTIPGVATSLDATRRCRVELLPAERLNRDFILRGRIMDHQAACGIVSETTQAKKADESRHERRTTFAITIVPPSKTTTLPSQVVYLLDRSGSMSGWKLAAARRGLSRLVDKLGPRDQFQAAAFDDHLELYRPDGKKSEGWINATDANRFAALRWLSNIETNGGTEMRQAVEYALQACRSRTASDELANQAIVLITDGQVTGEDALLRLIDSMPADRIPRLFCLGVDRAVNASVLMRISRRTGGTFELVESEQRLDEVLARFADEIASPALTELTISSNFDAPLNIAPANLTTLYTGRAQTIYGRHHGDGELNLTVRAKLSDGMPYEAHLTVAASPSNASTPRLQALWAKERIRTMEDDLFATGMSNDLLKQEIVDCSLECGVLSRLTAFIAVDKAEKVTEGGKPHSILQPNELPEGWHFPLSRLDATKLLRVPRSSAESATLRQPFPSFAAVSDEAARKMLELGVISAEQLTEAQSHAKMRGLDVCGALVELHYATYESVAENVAGVTKTSYIQVRQLKIDQSIIQLLPESVARENHVLPIADSSHALTVVMANPNDTETIEKLRFILNRNILTLCGAHDAIAEAINQYYGAVEAECADSILQEFTDTQIDFTETESDLCDIAPNRACEPVRRLPIPNSPGAQPSQMPCVRLSRDMLSHLEGTQRSDSGKMRKRLLATKKSPLIDENSAPIVRLVSLLLHEAVQLRASHIIAEVDGDRIRLMFVIDGKLVERDQPPVRLWSAMLSRLKILAKLNITQSEGVQTGKIRMTIGQRDVELTFHATSSAFLIELPDTKKSTVTPEAVEKWWISNGVAAH